ncbi:uncharacterized protein EV420DRAFT_606928 [Desarmillaria tabescens]|uniref:Uncharacterized protein n=1 Tax=Armillaria tabescens TaxID=1929756 RepID=A0AA39K4B3_ARMTA|nr:uncharacterized protein EV420DRAFT_606928 [Desarmillaria tabescens]KAK0454270.1 hypothetical protein EV420DRAFT_606928 [Desarmillaria tabescens]
MAFNACGIAAWDVAFWFWLGIRGCRAPLLLRGGQFFAFWFFASPCCAARRVDLHMFSPADINAYIYVICRGFGEQ